MEVQLQPFLKYLVWDGNKGLVPHYKQFALDKKIAIYIDWKAEWGLEEL
jgi:hypothetical protein